ncbi:FtsL-like putative cell division protein [Cochleicola gelatinilyticus]|uniref:S-adenosyl-methyltransferase n=1 Tax=Cochleicola gelatinilyticus TaxID=1763537 RepID=A0A167F0B9_9FLAO|nr:FtsL-like putative cell division protein [Cochleicola gelatinilyticus]OAB76057.1 S-adenosyl-methyltransferase [Cochleicola gelatinilyticus]
MKDSFYNIVKGTFLVNDDSLKNWRFILFLSVLALIMIASSHTADKKVHKISRLSKDVKELKSEYVDIRMKLMQTKMESEVIAAMAKRGLQPSVTPPQKIKIVKLKE